MTNQSPERRSNRTHTWLIVVLVIVGLLAVSGVGVHHFDGGVVTIDGQSLHDLNPLEAILGIIFGVIGAIIGILAAIISVAIGLAAALFGVLVGLLGAFFGLAVTALVLGAPLIIVALIVWAIVKATSSS